MVFDSILFMLKIRLQRVGRKHDPSYRIILTDAKQGPKSGKFVENLGFYDARSDVKQVKGERVKYWIGNGAQVSDTVHNILISEKIIDGKKINALPKKTPIVKEVIEEEKKEVPAGEDEKKEAVEKVKVEEKKEVVEEEVKTEEKIEEPVVEEVKVKESIKEEKKIE